MLTKIKIRRFKDNFLISDGRTSTEVSEKDVIKLLNLSDKGKADDLWYELLDGGEIVVEVPSNMLRSYKKGTTPASRVVKLLK